MNMELKPCPFCNGAADCQPEDRGSGGQHLQPYLAGCFSCKVFFVEEEDADAITAWNRRAPAAAQPVSAAFEVLKAALQADPDYAWTWHCNIAVPSQDEGLDHYRSNCAAARFMYNAFGVDTSKSKYFPAAPPAAKPVAYMMSGFKGETPDPVLCWPHEVECYADFVKRTPLYLATPPAAKQEDAQPVARLTGEQVAELAQRYLSETECILLLRLQAPDEIRPSTNLWAFVDALSDLLAPPAGERDAVDVDLLRAEHTEMRDMLADARIELQMIREALGVSYEPHQTLLERTMDAARREGLR